VQSSESEWSESSLELRSVRDEVDWKVLASGSFVTAIYLSFFQDVGTLTICWLAFCAYKACK